MSEYVYVVSEYSLARPKEKVLFGVYSEEVLAYDDYGEERDGKYDIEVEKVLLVTRANAGARTRKPNA
jgi:hypothetical protein